MLKKLFAILVCVIALFGCGNKVEILNKDIAERFKETIFIPNMNEELKKTKNIRANYDGELLTLKNTRNRNEVLDGTYYFPYQNIYLIAINIRNNKVNGEMLKYKYTPLYSLTPFSLESIAQTKNGKIVGKNYHYVTNYHSDLESCVKGEHIYRDLILEGDINRLFRVNLEIATIKAFAVNEGYRKIFEIKKDPINGRELELIEFDDKGNKIREIKRVSESRQIEVKEFENGKEKNVRKISC